MGVTYVQEYALNTYDFDKNGKVRLTSLVNCLQDISTRHFESAVKDRYSDPLGLWVIVEWKLDIIKMPETITTIRVTTEPTYFRKFIAYRGYMIEDENGEIIGTGVSKWAYLDIGSRRQANIPAVFNEIFKVEEGAYKPERMVISVPQSETSYKAKIMSHDSDLDVNQHVNNVVYIRWALDALQLSPLAFDENWQPKTLKVNFKKEVFAHTEIDIESFVDDLSLNEKRSIHRLKNNQGELSVDLEIEWIKISG
jgi:acyl-ACP thioesterase